MFTCLHLSCTRSNWWFALSFSYFRNNDYLKDLEGSCSLWVRLLEGARRGMSRDFVLILFSGSCKYFFVANKTHIFDRFFNLD